MALRVYISFINIPNEIKRIAIPGVMLVEKSLPYFGEYKNIPYHTITTGDHEDNIWYEDVIALNMQVPEGQYTWYKYYVFEREEDKEPTRIEKKVIREYNDYGYKKLEVILKESYVYKYKLVDAEPEAFVYRIRDKDIAKIEGEAIIDGRLVWGCSKHGEYDESILLIKGKEASIILKEGGGRKWKVHLKWNGEEVEKI